MMHESIGKAVVPVAAEFMNTNVNTVTAEMSLAEVIQFLLKHHVSNAPVIDNTGNGRRLVGFISERDCLVVLSNEAFYGSPAPPQRADTMMRKHPICVSPTTELFALASIFVNHDFRHLPVTENDQLLGIVSRRDVLKAMDHYYQQYRHDVDEHRTPRDLTQIVNHRFLVSE